MTSCGKGIVQIMFVMVVGLDYLSAGEENCNIAYFQLDFFRKIESPRLPRVVASNLKDSLECSAERQCLGEDRDDNYTNLFVNCFERNGSCTETPKCRELKANGTIGYYHFLCLTAKLLGMESDLDCEYDKICPLMRNLPRAEQITEQPLPFTTGTTEKKTPTPPPPPPTTTTTTTTTVKVTTTTLPARTTTAPTMSQPGTQSTITSGSANSQSMLQNGNSSSHCVQENSPGLVALLVIILVSVIFHVLGLIHMRQQNKRIHNLEKQLAQTPGVQPQTEMQPLYDRQVNQVNMTEQNSLM